MNIFISHSSKNEKLTKRLCEMLESNGHSCVLASQDSRFGKGVQSISKCEALLLILSDASNQSEHVLKEIEYAVSHCMPTLVYQIEDVRLNKSLEYFLMSNQWIVGKDVDNYDKILEGIKNIENNHPKDSKDSPKEQKKDVQEKKKPADTRKRVLEIVELAAVAAICFFMFLHERDVNVKLAEGDTVTFGTYLGESITWRVIQTGEKNEAVLISEDILTFKAFNAAESGRYNRDDEKNDYWSMEETKADQDLELQAYVRGNSCWDTSDLRTWLNSDQENVVYDGIGPVESAMSEAKNGYIEEPGFLTGFTEQEKNAIVPTQHLTNGNALDQEPVESTDLVYLLSKEELSWLEEANVNIYAKPTSQAIEQDETSWYRAFSTEVGVESYYWWLREPVPDKSSKCFMVNNGYNAEKLVDMDVGVEGFGVRPVIKINTKKIKFKQT